MDALPQPRSIGMQENIAASFVESCGDAADYGMLQRLIVFRAPPNPKHWSRRLRQHAGRNFHHRCGGIGLRVDLVLICR